MYITGELMLPAYHDRLKAPWHYENTRKVFDQADEKAKAHRPPQHWNGPLNVVTNYNGMRYSWTATQDNLRRNVGPQVRTLSPNVSWSQILEGKLGDHLEQIYLREVGSQANLRSHNQITALTTVSLPNAQAARFSLYAWWLLGQIDNKLALVDFQTFVTARREICWSCKKQNAWRGTGAARTFTCPQDCAEYKQTLVKEVRQYVDTAPAIRTFLDTSWEHFLTTAVWKNMARGYAATIVRAQIVWAMAQTEKSVRAKNFALEAAGRWRPPVAEIIDWQLLVKRLRRRAHLVLSEHNLHRGTRPRLAPSPTASPARVTKTGGINEWVIDNQLEARATPNMIVNTVATAADEELDREIVERLHAILPQEELAHVVEEAMRPVREAMAQPGMRGAAIVPNFLTNQTTTTTGDLLQGGIVRTFDQWVAGMDEGMDGGGQ